MYYVVKERCKCSCISAKTSFCNCGLYGCQLRAVRLPTAGRTARNRKTKKYIRDKHILQGASGSFPPGIGTLYPGDCPAHTRYNPIFHTVFRMQAQSIIRRKTAGIRCKRQAAVRYSGSPPGDSGVQPGHDSADCPPVSECEASVCESQSVWRSAAFWPG